MNVMAAALSIGIVSEDHGVVSGTIDENVVLASISELAAAHPGNDDLFVDAVMRVQLAPPAGVAGYDTSVLHRHRSGTTVQLRYRTEMAEVFTDLAIDVGLRDAQRLVDTSVRQWSLCTRVWEGRPNNPVIVRSPASGIA